MPSQVVPPEGDLVAVMETRPTPYMVLVGESGDPRVQSEAFRRIKACDPYTPLLLLASGEQASTPNELDPDALARIRLPLRHLEFEAALQKVKTYRENRHQEGSPRSLELFRSLVGSSAGIHRVRNMIEMVARSDANVLIVGESGTGKEVVARHVHHHSNRRSKPFVPLNCGAIPPDLLESELFGHEKGAFTGAIASRQGRFEMADGGTLFLDEIGDMSLSMQVKLLRVLQERTFERVGSNRSHSVNVRIIAATHVNLDQAIREGRFREDLFYRLNVFPIETPPLRARTEDLPLLVNDLVERLEHEGRGTIRLTQACIDSLTEYHWPGNVRELANLVERLSILYPNGVVDVHDLPEKYRSAQVVARVPAKPQDLPATAGGDGAPAVAAPLLAAGARLPRAGLDLKEHLPGVVRDLILQAREGTDWGGAHAAT
ncbi:MAG: sigma-54 dependent transcriptional regulator, partial [Gammaproteobacteria bacterium]|nr:sigma-54 dependent transcriptional regulator [Gammaproteobacteria bacterium]